MWRTLFSVRQDASGAITKWISVRIGDVDERGNVECTVTYKTFAGEIDGRREAVISIGVEDYEEAIELLEKIGCEKRSSQETIRTRYSFEFNHAMYHVTIDRWPWLDEWRVITVEPRTGVDFDALDEAAQHLKLRAEKRCSGVDETYKRVLGFRLSDIEEVRFGIPCPPGL